VDFALEHVLVTIGRNMHTRIAPSILVGGQLIISGSTSPVVGGVGGEVVGRIRHSGGLCCRRSGSGEIAPVSSVAVIYHLEPKKEAKLHVSAV
jgi:hypothetical protein